MPTERERADALLRGDPRAASIMAPLLIMGLFQYYKWDIVRSREAGGGGRLSNDQIADIANGVTEQQWRDYEVAAHGFLREITASKDKWAVPIAQGVISAFLYSVLLLVGLLVIQRFDIDILHMLGIESKIVIERTVAPPNPANPPSKPAAPRSGPAK